MVRMTSPNEQIALALSAQLVSRLQKPNDYLSALFPLLTEVNIATDSFYVVQVEDGQIQTGDLSSLPLQWWLFLNGSLCRVAFADMKQLRRGIAFNCKLWTHAILTYYVSGDWIITREAYGDLTYCKRRVQFARAPHIAFLSEDLVQVVDLLP